MTAPARNLAAGERLELAVPFAREGRLRRAMRRVRRAQDEPMAELLQSGCRCADIARVVSRQPGTPVTNEDIIRLRGRLRKRLQRRHRQAELRLIFDSSLGEVPRCGRLEAGDQFEALQVAGRTWSGAPGAVG